MQIIRQTRPKIHAKEIIDEVEPIKRGIYSGVAGYLLWYSNMDNAIAIRTAVIKDKQLSIQAEAGLIKRSRRACCLFPV